MTRYHDCTTPALKLSAELLPVFLKHRELLVRKSPIQIAEFCIDMSALALSQPEATAAQLAEINKELNNREYAAAMRADDPEPALKAE